MRSLLLALPLLLAGCTSPFAEAQQADTIEAYETFLAENQNSPHRIKAELRLADLYLEQARAKKTLEAYDEFVEKFPDSELVKKAMEERREFLWKWADAEDTRAAWQKYLDEYPRGDKDRLREARQRLRMSENKDAVEVGPVEMEMVNLAEDPDGPLNGYGFYVDVKNMSDKEIRTLVLRIQYLDTEGNAVGEDEWPVVAPRLPGNLPFEEGFDKPIEPGESRTWEWTTGDLPEGWSKKSKVAPIDIRFVGDD